ncbi:MAG: hypothetical protein DWQ04_15300 [Chloroflexi bacterium]|nr:MAG: hypothetical protein DWQ04_15300 [Chloroflexota bacterium]
MKNKPIIVGGVGLVVTAVLALLADSFVKNISPTIVFLIVGDLLTALLVFWLWHQEQLQNAREQQKQRQGVFINRLHHQMKNPLQVLKLGLNNLHHRLPQEEETVRRLQEHTARLSQLASVLHQLHGLDEQSLAGETVQLAALLEDEVNLLRQRTGREIVLRLQITPWELSPVLGDRDLLRQAFTNILENGIKYSNDKTPIEVRANDDGKLARIEIGDSGVGILPGELPQIGQQLFRGSNTQGVSGSGLGLAMVNRIIALHGGEVDVSSRVNEGTLVRVQLPVARA